MKGRDDGYPKYSATDSKPPSLYNRSTIYTTVNKKEGRFTLPWVPLMDLSNHHGCFSSYYTRDYSTNDKSGCDHVVLL